MAGDEEFGVFIQECRKLGLAGVKAADAELDALADVIPEPEGAKVFREKFIKMMTMGAELARFEDKIQKESDHGC